MSDRIIEQIVNIKEEIRDIAALKNHTHEDLIKTSNIKKQINIKHIKIY